MAEQFLCKCYRCGNEKPQGLFALLPGSKKRARVCNDCRRRPPVIAGMWTCQDCGEGKPFSSYAFSSGARNRRRVCSSCDKGRPRMVHSGTLKCSLCSERKAAEEFAPRTGSSRKCLSCAGNRRRKAGETRQSPHPCTGCGQPIVADLPFSRLRLLKYCSNKCRHEGGAVLHTCTRCLAPKYPGSYARTLSGKRRSICLDCLQRQNDAGLPFRSATHATPVSLCESLRQRARHRKAQCHIRPAHVRTMIEKGCCLCGGSVQAVWVPKDAAHFTAKVAKGVCPTCRVLLRARSYDDLVSHVSKIAAHLKPKEHPPHAAANAGINS